MGFWDGVKVGEGWRPEVGDKIAGSIAELRMGESQYGVYPIVTIRTDTGEEIAVHCFHTELKKQLKEQGPDVADEIMIVYDGMGPDKKHAYRVAVNKDAPI